MEALTVEQLVQHIQKLPEAEKSQLAKQVLPMLLRSSLRRTEEILTYLEKLFDAELDVIVEQVRERNQHFKEEEISNVISEALQEVRASSRA
jgi:predicted S18 family serine protease